VKSVLIKDGHPVTLTEEVFYTGDMNESWLQEVLFSAGDLLNQTSRDSLDPIIPLCRELPLRGSSSTVFLDILAVRASGRPVLIECKLWKNPQARREVIGQILEYGALLQGQSYSDVDAQVRSTLKNTEISIWREASRQCDLTIDEASFVDHFSNCLMEGSFDLILAGDGIRSDVKSVVSFLERSNTLINSIHLLEVSVFKAGQERLIVAQAPIQITAQRFVQVATGEITNLEDNNNSNDQSKKRSREDDETNIKNRQFWDQFISRVRFSHVDQDKPRHGGRNWVKIPYFPQVNWITAYRLKDGPRSRVGLFMTFNGDRGDQAYTKLLDQWDTLVAEIPELDHQVSKEGVGEIYIKKFMDVSDETSEEDQLDWLTETSVKLTDTLTPIFEAMDRLDET
jgi:hypothetical protein